MGFRIISVSELLKSGRSDWIRTSDPYPPRKAPMVNTLIYRAMCCAIVPFTFVSVPLFLYQPVSEDTQ